MTALKEAAEQFLATERIAVAGVSRDGAHGGNVVYRRLRERGYTVFALNPNAETVEGDPAYPDVNSIPGGVEAVVVATAPAQAKQVVEQCAEAGVKQVWLHRSFGTGSVSEEAVEWGRQHGVRVIDGACPCMFGKCSDPGHKLMRAILGLTGGLPKEV